MVVLLPQTGHLQVADQYSFISTIHVKQKHLSRQNTKQNEALMRHLYI